jgi:ubiquinol-cytochrome c reductase cytochrome c subunit
MIKRVVRLSLGAAVLIALGGGIAAAASVEKGKAMFMKAGCYQCHGTMGQGGITGPRIAPDPLPYETLSAFIRSSSRNMPPYREKILPEADLQDIYAYLQSIPKPPDINSIPLLKP